MIPGTLRPSRLPRSLTVAGVRWPLRWVVRQRQVLPGLEVHGVTVMAAQIGTIHRDGKWFGTFQPPGQDIVDIPCRDEAETVEVVVKMLATELRQTGVRAARRKR